MTLQGSFFQGPQQSGRRNGRKRRDFRRQNYLGSGIFAATKR